MLCIKFGENNMAATIQFNKMLDGASSTATGTAFDFTECGQTTFTVTSTGVTTGATVLIEGSDCEGNFSTATTIAVTAAGSKSATVVGYYHQYRAKVSSYTDGTHKVNGSGISY
jgi:hypothetical protein